jgi:phosphate transport system substrate-binding protein
MKMNTERLRNIVTLGIVSTLCLTATPTIAQTTLTSKDGTLSFEGELTNVDAENYFIKTDLGELVLGRVMVDCSGEGCPSVLQGNQIVLTSANGSIRLEGEFVDVTETDIVILTDSGELTVRRELVSCEGPACPGVEVQGTSGRNVALTALGGGFTLEGELIDITDSNYVIDTANGELIVRRELVTCEGNACPTESEGVEIETLVIAGPDDIGLNVIRTVVQTFSDDKSLNVTSSNMSDGSADLIVGDDTGVAVAQINAQPMQARDALNAVITGRADFALVREEATPGLLSELTGQTVVAVEDVLFARTIALDALSVVTHASNPIDTLSVDTLGAILSGRVTNWSEIGGPTGKISIYGLDQSTELMGKLRSEVLGDPNARMTDYTVLTNITELSRVAQSDPLALSVVYRSQQAGLRALELASSCNIYYGSSDFAIQTQEYPFVVGWHLYAAKEATQTEFGANLISFLQTDDGQQTLSSLGLLSQSLRLQAMKEQGARVLTSVLAAPDGQTRQTVSTYFEQVAESRRLSTSLRFTSGSSIPDGKALEDIRRISAIVRSPAYENYSVKLVGFSDSVGAFAANQELSTGRASAIAQLLLDENPGWLSNDNVEVFGAGPIAPVACNDLDAGRQLNRRVEVWLTPPSQ